MRKIGSVNNPAAVARNRLSALNGSAEPSSTISAVAPAASHFNRISVPRFPGSCTRRTPRQNNTSRRFHHIFEFPLRSPHNRRDALRRHDCVGDLFVNVLADANERDAFFARAFATSAQIVAQQDGRRKSIQAPARAESTTRRQRRVCPPAKNNAAPAARFHLGTQINVLFDARVLRRRQHGQIGNRKFGRHVDGNFSGLAI